MSSMAISVSQGEMKSPFLKIGKSCNLCVSISRLSSVTQSVTLSLQEDCNLAKPFLNPYPMVQGVS